MKYYLLTAIAAALLASGCAPESNRPQAQGEGAVRAINAISASPDYRFLNEERFLATLNFGGFSGTSRWDGLEYTFNFDTFLVGDLVTTRVASQFIAVEDNRDYTMVLTGAIESPDVILWEEALREWEETDTTYEVRVGNTSTELGPVDVYYDLAGTLPVDSTRIGTIDFGEILPPQEYEAGERTLILTAVDDPATILFESRPLTTTERSSILFTTLDTDANALGPVVVQRINTTSNGTTILADVNTESTLRYFHSSRDMGNVDIYVDDPLTTPVVSNQAFREYTGDLPQESGEVPLTYTAAGNMGAILIDADGLFSPGLRYNLYAIRATTGSDLLLSAVSDRRSIATVARLSIINTSADNRFVDVYVVEEGESIEEAFPLFPSLSTLAPPTTVTLIPNRYDIYITDVFQKTPLAEPVSLDASAGDVFESIVYDTDDPAVPQLEFIPLP